MEETQCKGRNERKVKGQENPGVTARRGIKETAFPKKHVSMSHLDVLLNKVSPKGFLQTVDWEDTRQESRGTNTHWCLSHVCFCLLENPLKMYISPLPIAIS